VFDVVVQVVVVAAVRTFVVELPFVQLIDMELVVVKLEQQLVAE
jgi:hypothetical protein